MKNKTHFRIVCLRNEEGREERMQKCQVLVTGGKGRPKGGERDAPNVVHLSARLQDDVYQGQRIKTLSQYREQDGRMDEQTFQQLARQRMQRQREQQISCFLQSREQALKKDKNTIKSFIGSINFANNRRKERRIASQLKFTMKNASASAKCINQKEDSDIVAINRDLLESDFQTFLRDKAREKGRKVPNDEQREDEKLKKLSIINPQQPPSHTSAQPLNLFHFLSRSPLQKRSPSSSLSHRSKLDRLLFNLPPALQGEQFSFEWSRLGAEVKEFSIKE